MLRNCILRELRRCSGTSGAWNRGARTSYSQVADEKTSSTATFQLPQNEITKSHLTVVGWITNIPVLENEELTFEMKSRTDKNSSNFIHTKVHAVRNVTKLDSILKTGDNILVSGPFRYDFRNTKPFLVMYNPDTVLFLRRGKVPTPDEV